MDIKPIVSVIIPVYKAEKYLETCVRSVMRQSYRNLEIILVDDGSPDRCPEICDYLSEEHSRIKVIHQQNGGVAAARNKGLEKMTGEYLYFVDSDDIVAANAIATLMEVSIVSGADMVCAQRHNIDENGNVLEADTLSGDVCYLTKKDAMKYYAPLPWLPWNRLMRANVHREIRFPPYRIHEDEALKFKLLSNCEIIALLDVDTYAYRIHQESITAAEEPKMDKFNSRKENYEWLEQNYPNIIPFFCVSLWEGALQAIHAFCREGDVVNPFLQEIHLFCNQHWLHIFLGKKVTASLRLRLILFVLSSWSKPNNLYCRFYRLVGRL